MSLERLARELEETARQSAAMVDGATRALQLLTASDASCDEARRMAAATMVTALQGQDRIEQRCHNMALAVRQFAGLPEGSDAAAFDEIWASLVLDELRVPTLSGSAAHWTHGEVELF